MAKHIEEKDDGWRKKSKLYRENVLKSLPFEAPWANAGKECVGIAADAARARDAIEIVALNALAEARKKHVGGKFDAQKVLNELVTDISQNPIRGGKVRSSTKLPCLCSSTHVFIYGRDFLLPGRYHPWLSGFPGNLNWESMLDPVEPSPGKRAKQTDRSKRSLDRVVRHRIGESFSLPQACCTHAAIFLLSNMPWWRSQNQIRT